MDRTATRSAGLLLAVRWRHTSRWYRRTHRRGAQVAFVERLHSKVFHSEFGTVLGSANLSDNALGGALIETAIYLPPGAFPVDALLNRLKREMLAPGSSEFAVRFARLRREHNAYRQRNPAPEVPALASDVGTVTEIESGKVPSFGEWFNAPNRAAWQLGAWTHYASVPDDVAQQQLESSGRETATFISDEAGDKYDLSLPTLECRFHRNQYRISKNGMQWWYPKIVCRSADAAWAESPYFFLADELVPTGCTVPFDIREPQFKKALSDAVLELGEKSEQMKGPVSDEFIKVLARHYFGQA